MTTKTINRMLLLAALLAPHSYALASDYTQYVARLESNIPDSLTCICTGCPDDLAGRAGDLYLTITRDDGRYYNCMVPTFDRFGNRTDYELCSDFVIVPF